MDNVGYVVTGYALTAGALSAYLWNLIGRARRASRMADLDEGPSEPPAPA